MACGKFITRVVTNLFATPSSRVAYTCTVVPGNNNVDDPVPNQQAQTYGTFPRDWPTTNLHTRGCGHWATSGQANVGYAPNCIAVVRDIEEIEEVTTVYK